MQIVQLPGTGAAPFLSRRRRHSYRHCRRSCRRRQAPSLHANLLQQPRLVSIDAQQGDVSSLSRAEQEGPTAAMAAADSDEEDFHFWGTPVGDEEETRAGQHRKVGASGETKQGTPAEWVHAVVIGELQLGSRSR